MKPAREAGERGDAEVVDDRQLQHQPFVLAILSQQADAERLGELGAASAHQPEEAEDLSGMGVEGNVVQPIARKPANRQRHRTGGVIAVPRKQILDAPPDHVVNEGVATVGAGGIDVMVRANATRNAVWTNPASAPDICHASSSVGRTAGKAMKIMLVNTRLKNSAVSDNPLRAADGDGAPMSTAEGRFD